MSHPVTQYISSRVLRIINFILMVIALSGALYILGVNGSEMIYADLLAQSQVEYAALAMTIFQLFTHPVVYFLVFVVMAIIIIKEFKVSDVMLKIKLNSVTIVLFIIADSFLAWAIHTPILYA